MIPLVRALCMFLSLTCLVSSNNVHGKLSNAIQKRRDPHCGFDLGPPDPADCKVALDYELPSGDILDNINYIPVGTPGPDDAITLPLFYQHGECIISVDTLEPDVSNWLFVKAAADLVIEECLEKSVPEGGMKDLGDGGHMLVMILSATNHVKPSPQENEATIDQACEQGKADDLQFCLDYKYYQDMEGPDSPGGARVCPQKDSFGTFYCKQSKDCCQGYSCSLKTLKSTGAALLLGIQKTLVNAAGICVAASSA
ncbi:MAG: hypothetical protein M1812_005750 [Candelaria pacifica]|nr:MAG: hypothetical protein M1812_005750 [Candelaria pacifica]